MPPTGAHRAPTWRLSRPRGAVGGSVSRCAWDEESPRGAPLRARRGANCKCALRSAPRPAIGVEKRRKVDTDERLVEFCAGRRAGRLAGVGQGFARGARGYAVPGSGEADGGVSQVTRKPLEHCMSTRPGSCPWRPWRELWDLLRRCSCGSARPSWRSLRPKSGPDWAKSGQKPTNVGHQDVRTCNSQERRATLSFCSASGNVILCAILGLPGAERVMFAPRPAWGDHRETSLSARPALPSAPKGPNKKPDVRGTPFCAAPEFEVSRKTIRTQRLAGIPWARNCPPAPTCPQDMRAIATPFPSA